MLISDVLIMYYAAWCAGQICLAAGFLEEHPVLGIIAAGVLAAALGVLFTVFCFRMRKHMEDKDNDRKH